MFRFSLLTITVFGLMVAPAKCEDPKLELKLSVSKSEIVQLEPIVLTVSVQNLSKEPQKIYPIFDPDAHYLKIFLTTDEGKTSWVRSGLISDISCKPYTFSPKDVIRYRLMLSGQPKDWTDRPGEYKLHITFSCLKDAKPLESKPVKLTVKPAEGVDKEALDRFRGYPQAEFLARGSTAEAIAEQFRFVIRKFLERSLYPVVLLHPGLGRAKRRLCLTGVKSRCCQRLLWKASQGISEIPHEDRSGIRNGPRVIAAGKG